MWILILGLAIFFAVHLTRVIAAPFRDAQVVANEGRWKGLYSLVSLVGFALIIWGWVVYRADAPEIYTPPDWGRRATEGLVLLAFISLAAAYSPPSHIKQWLQHPFLTAVILWSVGHLLANGDLASLLLFGSFLAYGVIDRIAVMMRPAPTMLPPGLRGDLIAIVVGAVAYAVVGFWLHGLLFGVSPFGG